MRLLKVEGLSLVWVEEAENEEEEQEKGSGYWDEHWSVNKPTTRYYYEGQMGIEEDYTRTVGQQSETDVTRYGLGRGESTFWRWTRTTPRLWPSIRCMMGTGT